MSIAWQDPLFNLKEVKTSSDWICVFLECKNTRELFYIINVYASVLFGEKHKLWDSLSSMKEKIVVGNCIVGGDFNTTLYSSKNHGGSTIMDSFRENMEDFISEWDLLDITPRKGRYTWSNG